MIRPIAILLSVFTVCAAACGNNPAVLSADNVAIDLTDTVCAPLESQTIGQPWVDFVCTLIEGTEDVIASVATAPDAGLTAIKGVKTFKVRVPAAEAVTFMATHRTSAKKLGAKLDGGAQ